MVKFITFLLLGGAYIFAAPLLFVPSELGGDTSNYGVGLLAMSRVAGDLVKSFGEASSISTWLADVFSLNFASNPLVRSAGRHGANVDYRAFIFGGAMLLALLMFLIGAFFGVIPVWLFFVLMVVSGGGALLLTLPLVLAQLPSSGAPKDLAIGAVLALIGTSFVTGFASVKFARAI
jgi:hypothetical protein